MPPSISPSLQTGYARQVAPPRGKGIYTREPGLYPNGDPVGYARALGCDFVVLLNGAGVEQIARRAKDVGLRVWLYTTPEGWSRDNWPDTFSTQLERVVRLGLDGLVADVENEDWIGQRDEIQSLAESLDYASRHELSIGLTSYPQWSPFEQVAAIAPLVWGSPQIYGIQEPGSNDELHRRAAPWRYSFADVVLSLAAYGRNAAEQQSYLKGFTDEPAAIFWQSRTTDMRILPHPGTELFNVIRDFRLRTSIVRQFFEQVFSTVRNPLQLRR